MGVFNMSFKIFDKFERHIAKIAFINNEPMLNFSVETILVVIEFAVGVLCSGKKNN